jgi:hypothetical protein
MLHTPKTDKHVLGAAGSKIVAGHLDDVTIQIPVGSSVKVEVTNATGADIEAGVAGIWTPYGADAESVGPTRINTNPAVYSAFRFTSVAGGAVYITRKRTTEDE